MTARDLTSRWKRYTFMLFCCFMVALAFIGSNSMLQAKGEENQRLAERLSLLEDEKNKLIAEKAALSSPLRVETIAREVLGMVDATEENTYYYTAVTERENTTKAEAAKK